MSRKLTGLANSAVLVAVALGAAFALRCGTPGSGTDAGIDEATVRRTLESLAARVLVPSYERFHAAALELDRATRTAAETGSPDDRAAAQQAWRDAMDAWQVCELMKVGPLGPSGEPGGLDLATEIYSWPITNRCRIDQELVEGSYTDPDAFALELVNVRGLDALEYLLFHDGPNNACAPLSPINADGTWAALGPDEIDARRAAYAATLATLVRRHAEALVAAWDPARGGFTSELTGAGGTVYASPHEALTAVAHALFYLDLMTKDRKVAAPAGLHGCPTAVCPELTESPLAEWSRQNVTSNLRGFELVLLGEEPGRDALGLDDLLASVGSAELAARMARATANAIGSVASVDADLQHAVLTDHDDVLALHAAIKAITDDLKRPFLTALSLRVPAEGGGDAD